MNYQQELKQYIEETGITQTAVARGLGVAVSAIGPYIRGAYTGDVAGLDVKVAAWLQRQSDKAKEQKLHIAFVATETAQKVQGLLKLAHTTGEAVVLYGQAGLGKTRALKEYKAKNQDVLLIETDPGYTAKVLLQDIAAKSGATSEGSLHSISEAIISKLADSGRLIMVDEAELLPLRALECLRRIHDKTGCGLVLAGMPRLLVNLKGRRGELVQLYSRVGFAMNLGDSLPGEELLEIAKTAMPDMLDDAMSEIVLAANGNTRRLCKMLHGVSRLEWINKAPADVRMVQEFKAMLIH